VQEVVEKYLDCGNPKNGFARIKCKDCGLERLLMFSCKTRGFYPSCHSYTENIALETYRFPCPQQSQGHKQAGGRKSRQIHDKTDPISQAAFL